MDKKVYEDFEEKLWRVYNEYKKTQALPEFSVFNNQYLILTKKMKYLNNYILEVRNNDSYNSLINSYTIFVDHTLTKRSLSINKIIKQYIDLLLAISFKFGVIPGSPGFDVTYNIDRTSYYLWVFKKK